MGLYGLILTQFPQLTRFARRFLHEFYVLNMSCLDFRRLGWMENIEEPPKICD